MLDDLGISSALPLLSKFYMLLKPIQILTNSRLLFFLLFSSINPICAFASTPSRVPDSPAIGSFAPVPDDPSLKRLAALRRRFVRGSTNLIDVNEAIRLAIANNPSLKVARSAIESQYYDLLAAQRQWIPTLLFSNSQPILGRVNSNVTTKYKSLPGDDFTTTTGLYTFAPSVTANWTFLSIPRTGAIKSNFYGLKSEQFLYAVSLRNLILSTQQAFYQVQSSKLLVDSFEQLYQINKKQLEILEARYPKRLVDLGSVSQAKTQYYQQLSELINAYNQYFAACAQLSNAIGFSDYRDLVPAAELKPVGTWNESLESTIKHGLEFREEIKSSLALARSNQWNASALYGTYYPSLSLTALGSLTINNGINARPSYATSNNQYDYKTTNLSSAIGLGFTWSLFDGGVNAANAKSSEALAKQQLATAIQNQELVASQIKTAFYQYQTSSEALRVTRLALDSAKQSQVVANVRFQVGLGDITTVVQTLQFYGQAYISYISALLDYNNSIAQLYRYSSVYPKSIEPVADEAFRQATTH